MFRVDRLSDTQKAGLRALNPTMRLDEPPSDAELRDALTLQPNISPGDIEEAIELSKQEISPEEAERQVQCFELSYELAVSYPHRSIVLATFLN